MKGTVGFGFAHVAYYLSLRVEVAFQKGTAQS